MLEKTQNRSQDSVRRMRRQRGQASLLVLLVISIFLLGFIGFSVDFSNLWFHRQAAQAAADAACQAGAMNLLHNANTGATTGNFDPTAGAFDCGTGGPHGTVNSTATPCLYARENGYSSTALTGNESNMVSVSFPGSVPNVTPPSASMAPVPFMRVDVLDRVRVFFSPLLTGRKTQDVVASATCGLVLAKAPIPIIVLNPVCEHSFEVSGAATLKIVGGPNKSVQVNSNNATCASATKTSGCSGSGTIDLSQGGPNFDGSNFGTTGLPAGAPSNFIPGTGRWVYPSSTISDPHGLVTPPSIPAAAPKPRLVSHLNAEWGCPDAAGCIVYFPGFYNRPIVVKGETALFVPGIYYIKPDVFSEDYAFFKGVRGNEKASPTDCAKPGCTDETKATGGCRADFLVAAGGVVRPAKLTGRIQGDDGSFVANDGSLGTMFYLSGSDANGWGAAVFTANAGSRIIDPYTTADVVCPDCLTGGVPDPTKCSIPAFDKLGIPSSIQGNILVAHCTTRANYVPYDAVGKARGLLFFQDRSNKDPSGQMSFQGGGGLILSGTLYSHNCPGSPACDDYPTDYNAFIQLQGTPGSGTYVLGEIISDQLVEAGTGAIGMQLSTDRIQEILKVQLLR